MATARPVAPGLPDGQIPVQAAASSSHAAAASPPVLQVRRVALPPMYVPALRPVPPVPGVAAVPYPALPAGTRDRRYWFF